MRSAGLVGYAIAKCYACIGYAYISMDDVYIGPSMLGGNGCEEKTGINMCSIQAPQLDPESAGRVIEPCRLGITLNRLEVYFLF
jgi:hypothetical protein